MAEVETIILFDTDCVLCSGGAAFVLRHERDTRTRFLSAWSDEGLAIARDHGLRPQDLNLTFLVVDRGRPLVKSDASLAVMRHLRAPWRWLRVGRVIPRPLRDWFYDRLAANRYQWFGHRDQCFVPPPGTAHRFVSGPPRSRVPGVDL